MCTVIKRALDCGQNFTFTLAEKILQIIVIENRTGRLAKENKKNGQAVFPILSVKFVIFLLWPQETLVRGLWAPDDRIP